MMSAVRRSLVTLGAGYGICTWLACTGNVPQSFSSQPPSEVGKTATAAVTTSGGTLQTASGAATVSVPAGALAGNTNLTVTVKAKSSAPMPDVVLSNVYDLGPSGTQFQQPVTLALKAADTAPVGQKPVLAFVNAQLAWQVVPNSSFDPNTGTVTGQVNHFTDFAVIFVAVDGTGCAGSPDPNAYCSPQVCDIVNNKCQAVPPAQTSFLVGGVLSGLNGGSVVLENNGGDLLTLSQNGNFYFATPQVNGATYLVAVAQQPNGQSCTINPITTTGTIVGADIGTVQVVCSPAYNVGGSVAGLGATPVVLQNGNTQVTVTATNPNFVLASLPTGGTYAVTVLMQPNGQDCEVTNDASGSVGNADVTDIVVQCTNLAYSLGGEVDGLVANANVILQNGPDTISVGNGNYTFPTTISFNDSYSVSITSPTGQICQFAPNVIGQGAMTAAPITSVDIICSPNNYTLGGNVRGLLDNTNVVLTNGNDMISVANGSYALPTGVAYASDYNVLLGAPDGQVCVAATPNTLFGTMPAAPLLQLDIVCSLGAYPVGGTISGLVANTNVTLSNGADTIYVGDGNYAFPTPVIYTRPYAVSIITSPPFQSCAFANAGTSAGTMPPDGVSNVDITCTPQGFTLGGGVTGLAGSGQVTLTRGSDSVTTGNGAFAFPMQVPYGANYTIGVVSPTGQTCAFAPAGSGNGTMPAANVSNLSLVCAASQYPLGGTISGLVSNTNVTLTNGADSISVSNGAYAFPTTLLVGANYAVSLTAPQAQTCTFSPGGVNAGSMVNGGFYGVNITCVPGSYMVGGTVSGLVSNTSLGIADDVDTINANNGAYTLPTPVVYGSTLTVTVNPPVGQSCTFGDGNTTFSTVMGNTDLTHVNISCGPVTYAVGGFVTGLVNSAEVTLQNGNDTIEATDGTYAFPTKIAYNSPYYVSLTSPPGQTCTFTGAHAGTMGAAAISNIGVSCSASAYTLGGVVGGLLAGTTVTVHQGGDVLTVGNGNYALPTQVPFGATYDITVTQPVGQNCVFGDGNTFSTAIMAASNIANANITCSPALYTLGGNVGGLVAGNSVSLQNGNDTISVGNGRYTFPTQVGYNSGYNATLVSPGGEVCTFTGVHNGTMGAGNVTNADVFCSGMPYALGGHVSGLVNGTTVTLRNGGDSIGVGNGNFVFPTQVVYNTSYSASLVSPSGQTCTFSPPSTSIGTMPANAVTSINVICGPQTYTLGGTVTGLVPNTNVTLQNGSDTIVVGNGTFTFDVALPYSTNYAVSANAPLGQSCTFVGNHAGAMGAANVTSLSLTCTPQTYALGGTVSGLVGAGTVTLQNGSDSLTVGNGSYTFATQVAYGASYTATLSAPSGQSCSFSPADSNAGTMPASAVGTVNVVCGAQTYTLGGMVSGLSPNNQVTLQNGSDNISVGNGSYTFPTALAFNSAYGATLTSPAGQTCVFSGAAHSGTMGAANIANLNVACSAQSYTLGGTVSGLVGSTQLTLQQGFDSIAVGNGDYTFPTPVAFGATYSASLIAPAGQFCAFAPLNGNSGTVPANNVTSINVSCGAQTYSLGGSVSGLVANTEITLANGNDTVTVPNGLYTFPTALAYGTAYAVSLTSPSGQSCAFVASHAGSMGAANVTNIGVNCTPLNYNLGGTVSGLIGSGTVTLQNGGDSISVSNGDFTFPTTLSYASHYLASLTSPSGQTCVFTPLNVNVGTMTAGDVNNIDVTCGPQTYTLGGSISGLLVNSNVMLQNGNDTISAGNGAYTFPTGLAYSTGYNVTLTSPVGQTCNFLGSPTGTMGATNVSNVGVSCSAQAFALGGTVSGLVGSGTVSLQNGGDSIAVGNGPYTFPTAVNFDSNYSASLISPSGQTCVFTPYTVGNGTMPASDVTNIDVSCGPQTYTLGGTVSGLVTGTQVTMQNGNDSIGASNGAFTFPTGLAFNTGYNATIVSPVGQSCVFSSGHNGTIGASNIASLRVTCSAQSFVLGGTVSGLIGNSLVDLQNGADNMAVSNGAYTFATPVPYASVFNATAMSPAGQDCEFIPLGSNTGSMPGNDVTTLNVACTPLAYTVGGTVAGLVGSAQVTLQNGGDSASVGNGNFTFATPVAYAATYAASLTSPAGQTCSFSGSPNGTVGAANVTSLVVTCAAQSYALGGSVSGLVGGTQVTLSNGQDNLAVGNGNYTFPTSVAFGATYAAQLTSPAGQTCSFSPTDANSGTMSASDVGSVDVICGSQTYTLGGNVAGLLDNTQVILQSGADSLVVGNGSYTFATALLYSAAYNVTITSPAGQSCTFDGNSSGTIGASNITDINLTCAPVAYALGGSVSGLLNNAQVTLSNGNDSLSVGNGNYTFPTQVLFQASYAAALSSPAGQSCAFSPGDSNVGSMPAGAVSSVNVDCGAQTYTLGGTVSGLLANANVTLQNGNDTLDIANGPYAFPTAVAYDANYAVTLTAPAGQTCVLTGVFGGSMPAGDVNNINVACTPTSYALGGSISGLLANAQVGLQNGNDTISVGNGNYTFPTQVAYQSNYAVALTSPQGQVCTFAPADSNAGTMPAADVTSVNITCAGGQTYALGGTVSGLLDNSNVTLSNGSDTLLVGNGAYTFPTPVAYQGTYAATLTSPDGQVCGFVGDANGIMGAGDITNLDVACALQSYTLGGSVSGLVGGANATLQNGNDTITVTNGDYTFPTAVVFGSDYAVSVTSPVGQTCVFSPNDANSATMGASAITDVDVTCLPTSYVLGGSVSGLLDGTSLTLQSGGDTVSVSNGPYTFPTPVDYNSAYAITLTAPGGQACVFVPVGVDSGTMPAADVSNANVVCSVDAFTVGGTVSGLAQGSNVILANGNDTVEVDDNIAFTFATSVPNLGTYDVSIITQPDGQMCTVTGGQGSINGNDVTDIAVNCASDYVLSVTVSGLVANTNLTVTNGNDSVTIIDANSALFPTQLAAGDAYDVWVSGQPVAQVCTVDMGTGTMPASDTSVSISCMTALSFTTSQAAFTVMGQLDFQSNGNGTDASTVSAPLGAVFAAPNGDLYLSDTEHLRVVGYHQGIPANPGMAFDFEIGQPDLVTSQSWTTPDANSYYPRTITGNNDVMVVTDGFDNRVLILQTFPETTVDADVVLGQPDFTSNGADCTQTSLNAPRGANAANNNQLLVADTNNNRILIWNSIPTSNAQGADMVLGQPDFTTCTAPGSNASSANTLSGPWDVWTDGNHVLVADTAANRVLVWNTFPTSNGQNADAVIGQPDWTTNVAGPIATALATPSGVVSDGNAIFIAEYDNMRVGQWAGLPWQNGTPALTVVLGEPDVNTANCGSPSDNSLCQVGGLSIVGTQLVVADTVNNRYMVFQSN